jgi:hypothetical protein
MSNRRKIRQDATAEVDGVQFKVTRKLVREASRKGWSGGQIIAVAMQRARPEAENITVHIPPNPDAADPTLRGGYVATPTGHYPLSEHVEPV